MAEYLRPSLHLPQQKQLFHQQQNKKVKSPQNEIPAGTMPQTCKEPDYQQIKDLTDHPFPVASQGNINILPKPCAQGNMPASPELRNALGNIRI